MARLPVRRSKYRVRQDEVGKLLRTADGILFDSQRECVRYCQLKLLLLAGHIKNLELQPKFRLVVGGVFISEYRGDFRYLDCKTGLLVVEDAKGIRTEAYRIKKKLVKALFGVEIQEV